MQGQVEGKAAVYVSMTRITYRCGEGSIMFPVRIDFDFDLMTLDGEVFPARRLLGRPTILVLLRYLG